MENFLNKEFDNIDKCGRLVGNFYCDGDIDNLEIEYQGLNESEYAIVLSSAYKTYTAAIFKVIDKAKNKRNFKFAKNKINDFDKIEIVDIYTNDIIGVLNEEKKEKIIKNENEYKDKEITLENINIKQGDENEGSKCKKEEEIKCNNQKEPKSKKYKIYKDKTKTQSSRYKKNSKRKISIDDLEKLDMNLFLERDPNHEFFIIDEDDKKLNDINIIYNGFVMPIIYPFMGYKNFIDFDKLPPWIFGKCYKGNEIKYYVYGILGTRTKDSQPFLGSTGFIYYKDTIYEDYGYWLMYISHSSGKICFM